MKKIKRILFDHCESYIRERIETATQALSDNREALLQDSKSSAGDKFETTREMLQQEIIRNESLLEETKTMQASLGQIDLEQPFTDIQNGCLVKTNLGVFFLAMALGKTTHQHKDYFIISINSPLGVAFRGKRAGDQVSFNGMHYKIEEIV